MPRPQFTLRALLVAMLVVAAFFAGIRFERERRWRETPYYGKIQLQGNMDLLHPPLRPMPNQ